MVELLRLATFLVFVALGLRVRRASDAARRAAVSHLVVYVLVLSALAGVLQRDDWPFTSHTIAVGRARADSRVCQTRFFGLDSSGELWHLDPYTFTPVYDSILQYWVEQALPRLDEAQRARVLSFLLARAGRVEKACRRRPRHRPRAAAGRERRRLLAAPAAPAARGAGALRAVAHPFRVLDHPVGAGPGAGPYLVAPRRVAAGRSAPLTC